MWKALRRPLSLLFFARTDICSRASGEVMEGVAEGGGGRPLQASSSLAAAACPGQAPSLPRPRFPRFSQVMGFAIWQRCCCCSPTAAQAVRAWWEPGTALTRRTRSSVSSLCPGKLRQGHHHSQHRQQSCVHGDTHKPTRMPPRLCCALTSQPSSGFKKNR